MTDFCPKCFTRADACAECTHAEFDAFVKDSNFMRHEKDAEIAALKAKIEELKVVFKETSKHVAIASIEELRRQKARIEELETENTQLRDHLGLINSLQSLAEKQKPLDADVSKAIREQFDELVMK